MKETPSKRWQPGASRVVSLTLLVAYPLKPKPPVSRHLYPSQLVTHVLAQPTMNPTGEHRRTVTIQRMVVASPSTSPPNRVALGPTDEEGDSDIDLEVFLEDKCI